MTAPRSTRRYRRSLPVVRYLILLATLLSLILTPLGNALAAPAQDASRAPIAQDGTEVPEEKSPNDPPQDAKPTEAPIETKEPPLETKPTEIPPTEPVQTEPPTTEPPPTEPAPTEQPATEPTSEPAPSEPGILSVTSTITVIKDTCDYPIGPAAFRPVDASSLAELLANCTPYNTDMSFTYTHSDTGTTLTQTTSGSTTSLDVQSGAFSMQEHLPPNHDSPVVGCESALSGNTIFFVTGRGETIRTHIDSGDTLTCYWFNIPIPPTTITVIKGLCDAPGFDPYSASPDELAANCMQSSGDATFTYQQTNTGDPASELTLTQTTTGDTTTFQVPPGNFEIQEDVPVGFVEPVVSCYIDRFDLDLLMPVDVDTIVSHIDLGVAFTCHWYNVVPGSTSNLTIHKWECPPGYDHTAPSADPTEDCDQPLDGVAFEIEGDNGHFDAATTGDSEPGTLTFTSLEPAGYTVTEALSAGYDASFVWSCTTAGLPASPTTPMSTGVTLTITTVAGWNTTCHWFNVRETIPPGSLTVVKYACGPTAWWSLSLCPIHHKGQDFDLLQWIDGAWVSYGVGTTDRSGQYTWTDLPPGKYALDEIGRDWCRITSDNMAPGGTAITVEPGQEAIVHVYNCATTKPDSPPVRVISLVALLLRDIWNPAP